MAMFVARHNAFLDGSAQIEGRHMLTALLTGNDAAFFKVLARLRVEPEAIRKLLRPFPHRAADPRQREIPFSSELRCAIETADAEADRTAPRELGTPELLLGLVATAGCLPDDLMAELGCGPEDVRAAAGAGL
jgi:ATP-dependent Clp protease ATP-binding subunit ClpA